MKVVIEGNLSQAGSYGIVNLGLAKALASLGNDVSLVGADISSLEISQLISGVALRDGSLTVGEPKHPGDVRIRQVWPPVWVRRNPTERLIVIQPWEFGSIPLNWIEGIDNVDAIWVPSEYCKRGFIQGGVDPDKVWVVPNGFDPDEVKYMGPKTPASKSKILFLGGTIFRKGVDVLIKAADQLSDRHLDRLELIVKVVGNDSYYKDQSILEENLVSHPRVNARTRVERHHLSRSDILNLIAEADLLVHPYRAEGFGLPVLEAMAIGTPILHTQNGATNEFCGLAESWLIPSVFTTSQVPFVGSTMLTDRCYWWEPSVESVTEALSRFIESDGSRYDLVEAARIKASLYSWEKVAVLAESAIRGLLDGGSPSDLLSSLFNDVTNYLHKGISRADILSKLVSVGDYGSALKLAKHLEGLADLKRDSEVSSIRDRLESITASNPDVWSLGPFRSAVSQSGDVKSDRFGYVHQFEGTDLETMKIAMHISGYFSGCKSILDLGCGQGSMLRVLRNQGKKVQGVEADPSLVKGLIRDGLQVQKGVVPGDLDSLEFDEFDGVFLGHIVEHLLPDDVERLFDWIFEKIADNGRILIQTPDISNPLVSMDNFWLDASHVRPYPVKLLKAMLSKSGFIPVEGACRSISEVAPLDIIALGRKTSRAIGPERVSKSELENSVQVLHVGLFSGGSGFSQASRLMFDASDYDNGAVEVVRVLIPQQGSDLFDDWKLSVPLKFSERVVGDVAVIDLPVSWLGEVSPLIRSGYRIARTTFEATPLPHVFAKTLKSFDEVWCFSNFDKEIFIASGIPESKLQVIPPGIGLPSREQLELSKIKSAGKFSFLSIFNFEPRKNPLALLKAFAAVVGRFPGCELVIKLSGVDIGEFISWMQRNISGSELALIKDRVRVITGTISRESLDRLYMTSDVFVLPTRGEGYGLPFLEALSFGIPVVCPDVGGHRDFCNPNNSLLVETTLEPASIADGAGVFQESFWREVLLEDLIEKMIQAVADPGLVERLKINALSESSKYTASGYQALASKRLLEIASALNGKGMVS